MLVDSHCHLDFPDLSGRLPEVLERAREAGVGRMVTISTRVAQFETYRAIAEAHEDVLFTVGTHPHNAGEEPEVPAALLVDFFFQAEDGIRDIGVTGVQTCALPI